MEENIFFFDSCRSAKYPDLEGLETRPKSPTTKSTKIFHEGHEGIYSFIALSLCSLRHFFVTFVVK